MKSKEYSDKMVILWLTLMLIGAVSWLISLLIDEGKSIGLDWLSMTIIIVGIVEILYWTAPKEWNKTKINDERREVKTSRIKKTIMLKLESLLAATMIFGIISMGYSIKAATTSKQAMSNLTTVGIVIGIIAGIAIYIWANSLKYKED